MTNGTTLKHKHIDATAVVIGVCSNGSIKATITDNSKPSAKLRKPKQDYIPKDCIDQWTVV